MVPWVPLKVHPWGYQRWPSWQGYTQVELAERIGIIQALVSDYERDKLRLNAEMLVRFAQAL